MQMLVHWTSRAAEDFLHDVAHAIRVLKQSPAFTLSAVLCLAIGIGATTAIFSLVYGVLMRPLPYRSPQELVAIWGTNPRQPGSKLFAPYSDFLIWREKSQTLADIAAITWATDSRLMTGHDAPRMVLAIPASANLFDMLGVRPALGRGFQPDDVSRACTVVLSHRFRQSVPDVSVGGHLQLGGESCAVIGVMPPEFEFFPSQTDLWTLLTPAHEIARNRERAGVAVFGRLKPGVSHAQAHAELKSLAMHKDGGMRFGAAMEPALYPLRSEFTWLAGRNLRTSLLMLFAAVAALLLIACVNVANLLLGRSTARAHEMTVRAALGCGRGRMLRQLLTESLVLAVLGCIGGLALGAAGVEHMRALNPVQLPPAAVTDLNPWVLAFAAATAVLTTVLFGFVPAWRASRAALDAALRSGSRTTRRSGRLTQGLVCAQVALSMALLAVAGLLMQSILRFRAAPLGFDARGLYQSPIKPLNGEPLAIYTRVLAAATDAGVTAALSTAVPMRSGRGSGILVVDGRTPPTPDKAVHDIAQQQVSAGYFECMRIPLQNGRVFAPTDADTTPRVAIVNAELARKYFPGVDPIGRRVRLLDGTHWLTIVGVVADEMRGTPYQEMGWVAAPILYRPIDQQPPASAHLLLRGASATDVHDRLRRLHPDAFLGSAEPVQRILDEYFRYPRFRAALSAAFSAIALMLAGVGLYGVLAQMVARRTREIGIRLALGARAHSVLLMVVTPGLGMAAAGVGVGLVLSIGLTRLLHGMLYGVSPLDPLTIATVVSTLAAVALVASYLPARRASRVDPTVALREE